MRAFVFIYGVIFVIIGISGMIPSWSTEGYLAGILRVNIWLNLIHLISGLYALVIGFFNKNSIRFYFQLAGIFYGALAILGFIYKENNIFGVIANNVSDTWFHVIIAVGALILGYGGKD